jgi:O-antigen ligase
VSVVQVGIYALTLAWVGGAVFAGFPVRRHWLFAPLAGAALWGCLQIAFGTTIYRWATEVAVLDWFTRFAVFFLALQVFEKERARERVLRWALWFGLALCVVAVLQRFTSPDRVLWLFDVEPGGVTMGPFVYHNQYAAFIETVMPLAIVRASGRRDEWMWLLAAAAMIASVVAGLSRAGFAVLLLETVALFLLLRRREGLGGRTLLAGAAVTLGAIVLFAASLGWEPLREKFARDDQLAERKELYLGSIEMTRDRPLMGFGLKTWPTAYPAYSTFDDGLFDNQAHNDWVQWAAEGGLPFLALMLAIAALLVRPAVRSVWGVGLLAVLIHCLVDYHFQQRPVFGYWYFALAGLLCAEKEE